MSPEIRDAHLNDFALRCFRDTADGDYIAARMAYRADLIPQALWASQQAIEKYTKCILLLRRIVWNTPNHSLLRPLEKIEQQIRLRLTPYKHGRPPPQGVRIKNDGQRRRRNRH